MSEEAGEMYFDKAQGTYRRRRGHRKSKSRRKGSASVDERDGCDAFNDVVTATRYMDGELAGWTWKDIKILLVRIRVLCERYSFENYPEVSDVNPHIIRDSLDLLPDVPAEPDVDIYKGLQ